MPSPESPIIDCESLKLALASYTHTPTADAALTLVDQLLAQPDPLPGQLFELLSPAGRTAALVSWIGWYLENSAAASFSLPGSGREW